MRGGSGAHRHSVRPARNAGGCGGTSGSGSGSSSSNNNTLLRLPCLTLAHTLRLEGIHQHPHRHRPRVLNRSLPLHPRHVVCCHRNGGVGAQLPADSAEAGRAGVRLPGALPGCGSRDEPGVGDCRRPVLPVPVGVLLEASEQRELALQQHAGFR